MISCFGVKGVVWIKFCQNVRHVEEDGGGKSLGPEADLQERVPKE